MAQPSRAMAQPSRAMAEPSPAKPKARLETLVSRKTVLVPGHA
jgi:hypothetical protein